MNNNKHKDILLNSQNIVIIRTDKLGDMILTLPMVKAIKGINPSCKVHIIAKKYTEPILRYSSKNINYEFEYHFVDDVNTLKIILNTINPEVIFYPRPRLDESLSGFFSSAKLRIGTGYRYYSFLYNHKVYEHRKIGAKNEAEYNISLIENVYGEKIPNNLEDSGLLNIKIPNDELKEFKTKIKSMGINLKKPPILIHPATGGSAKEWHPKNFGKLAKKLTKEFGNDIIITGTEEETLQCKQVEVECVYSKNLCGKLDLSEMIKLISLSSILVANSTGVLHIAAAAGIPVVGLYPNSPNIGPKRWSPFVENPDKKIILSPPIIDDEILRDDLSLIKVEDVLEACKVLIQKNNN